MASLAAQSQSVRSLVITDNGSSDATVSRVTAIARSMPFPVGIVKSSNVGFAAGVLAAGQHSLVDASLPTLCINPDLELAAGALPAMLSCLYSDDRVGVVTAPLVGIDGEPDSASVRKLPKSGTASVYAVLGRLTPKRLRYNNLGMQEGTHSGPISSYAIEATTGALMLVNPSFRSADVGLFDTQYWMYGEDLQLCEDARVLGWKIMIAGVAPSLHIKGVSSGWPRSARSNKAFHDALRMYYDKNLSKGGMTDHLVHAGILVRYALTHLVGGIVRKKRDILEGVD